MKCAVLDYFGELVFCSFLCTAAAGFLPPFSSNCAAYQSVIIWVFPGAGGVARFDATLYLVSVLAAPGSPMSDQGSNNQ